MAFFSQVLINGLLAGVVYVLIALGFTLVFQIVRLVNFAHGEFYMMGAALVLLMYGNLHIYYLIALLLAAVVVGLIGALLQIVLFKRYATTELNGMILSLGVAICIQAIALLIMGPNWFTVPRLVSKVLNFGTVTLPVDRIVVGLLALFLALLFYVVLRYSNLGRGMRAAAQDSFAAELYGIKPVLIKVVTLGVGAALAALAGGLMAPIYPVAAHMGEAPLLKAFIVVVLGGLGSLPGAVLGGLILGLVESIVASLLDSTFALIASFAAVILILLIRPHGLLGKAA